MRNRIANQPSSRNIATLVRSAFLHARMRNGPGLQTLKEDSLEGAPATQPAAATGSY